MAFDSYSGLKASIQAWLDNNNPNLIASIPDMIVLAESWMNRHLRTRETECFAPTPLAPEDVTEDCLGIYALPTGWNGARTVRRVGAYLHLLYNKRIPTLSNGQPTNWLLEKYPDLYLYASLANSEAWMKNDERVAMWAKAATEALQEVNKHDWCTKVSGSPLRSRPRSEAFWGTTDAGTAGTLEYLPPFDFFDLTARDPTPLTDQAGWYTITEDRLHIWPKPAMPS